MKFWFWEIFYGIIEAEGRECGGSLVEPRKEARQEIRGKRLEVRLERMGKGGMGELGKWIEPYKKVSVAESSIIIKLTGIDSPFLKGARGIFKGGKSLSRKLSGGILKDQEKR